MLKSSGRKRNVNVEEKVRFQKEEDCREKNSKDTCLKEELYKEET